MKKFLKKQIKKLCNLQSVDGRFKASTLIDGKKTCVTDAFFPSVFISSCLHNFSEVPEIQLILNKTALFSKMNKQKSGNWNYWILKSQSYTEKRYPNDLDDTSLAILSLHTGKLLNKAILTKYIHNLKICSNGKSFNTWILPKKLRSPNSHWSDSDPVVNANISLTVGNLGIKIGFLNEYIDKCIEEENFNSKYYERIHVIYMIARCYTGDKKDKLINYLEKVVSNKKFDKLTTSFILSSFIYLNASDTLIKTWYINLNNCSLNANNKFYIESIKNNKTTFISSPGITLAASIEALMLYQRKSESATKDKIDYSLIKSFLKNKTNISNKFKRDIFDSIVSIYSLKRIRKIIELPRIIGSGLSQKDQDKMVLLGILGWTSYTIYDSIRDSSSDIKSFAQINHSKQTALANWLMVSFQELKSDLKINNEHNAIINRILERMEEANYFENTPSAFNKIVSRSIWKSMGASIPVLISISKMGGPVPDVKYCEKFFYDLIAARQLSDDAYDWTEDIISNKLTPVTYMLISKQNKEKWFIDHVSPVISRMIYKYSKRACGALSKIRCLEKNILEIMESPLFYMKLSSTIIQKYNNQKLFKKIGIS